MGQTLDYFVPEKKRVQMPLGFLSVAAILFPVIIHLVLGTVWLEARLALGRQPKFNDPMQWLSGFGLLALMIGAVGGVPVFVCGLLSNLFYIKRHSNSRISLTIRVLGYVGIWTIATILFIHDSWNLVGWLLD